MGKPYDYSLLEKNERGKNNGIWEGMWGRGIKVTFLYSWKKRIWSKDRSNRDREMTGDLSIGRL